MAEEVAEVGGVFEAELAGGAAHFDFALADFGKAFLKSDVYNSSFHS